MSKHLRRSQVGPTLKGFEGVFRFYDPRHGKVLAKILPGEYYLTDSPEEHIVTTLGSCISVCICDPQARIGGMNHFMLPGEPREGEAGFSPTNPANCYGVFAMESLVNSLLKFGASRQRMEIKVTGGGRIGGGPGSVGDRNVHFIQRFLELERLQPVAVDLGGLHARKVLYDPLSGRMCVKKLPSMQRSKTLAEEVSYQESITRAPLIGSVELFE